MSKDKTKRALEFINAPFDRRENYTNLMRLLDETRAEYYHIRSQPLELLFLRDFSDSELFQIEGYVLQGLYDDSASVTRFTHEFLDRNNRTVELETDGEIILNQIRVIFGMRGIAEELEDEEEELHSTQNNALYESYVNGEPIFSARHVLTETGNSPPLFTYFWRETENQFNGLILDDSPYQSTDVANSG